MSSQEVYQEVVSLSQQTAHVGDIIPPEHRSLDSIPSRTMRPSGDGGNIALSSSRCHHTLPSKVIVACPFIAFCRYIAGSITVDQVKSSQIGLAAIVPGCIMQLTVDGRNDPKIVDD